MSFAGDAKIVVEALDQYWQQSLAGDKPVIHQAVLKKLVADLDLAAHVSAGGLSGESLEQFIAAYLSTTTRLHHPAYMAHQVAVPH